MSESFALDLRGHVFGLCCFLSGSDPDRLTADDCQSARCRTRQPCYYWPALIGQLTGPLGTYGVRPLAYGLGDGEAPARRAVGEALPRIKQVDRHHRAWCCGHDGVTRVRQALRRGPRGAWAR